MYTPRGTVITAVAAAVTTPEVRRGGVSVRKNRILERRLGGRGVGVGRSNEPPRVVALSSRRPYHPAPRVVNEVPNEQLRNKLGKTQKWKRREDARNTRSTSRLSRKHRLGVSRIGRTTTIVSVRIGRRVVGVGPHHSTTPIVVSGVSQLPPPPPSHRLVE